MGVFKTGPYLTTTIMERADGLYLMVFFQTFHLPNLLITRDIFFGGMSNAVIEFIISFFSSICNTDSVFIYQIAPFFGFSHFNRDAVLSTQILVFRNYKNIKCLYKMNKYSPATNIFLCFEWIWSHNGLQERFCVCLCVCVRLFLFSSFRASCFLFLACISAIQKAHSPQKQLTNFTILSTR